MPVTLASASKESAAPVQSRRLLVPGGTGGSVAYVVPGAEGSTSHVAESAEQQLSSPTRSDSGEGPDCSGQLRKHGTTSARDAHVAADELSFLQSAYDIIDAEVVCDVWAQSANSEEAMERLSALLATQQPHAQVPITVQRLM